MIILCPFSFVPNKDKNGKVVEVEKNALQRLSYREQQNDDEMSPTRLLRMKSEHFINLHRTPRGFYNWQSKNLGSSAQIRCKIFYLVELLSAEKLGHLYLTEAEVLNDPDVQKKMGTSLKKHLSVFDKYSQPSPVPNLIKYQSSVVTQNSETEMDKLLLSSIDEHTHEESKVVLVKNPAFLPVKNPAFLPVLRIQTSSVFYIILVYLPMQKILQMQLMNKRFYNIYVPIVLKNVTSLGITPCKRRNLVGIKVLPQTRDLQVLQAPGNLPPLSNAEDEDQPLRWKDQLIQRRHLNKANNEIALQHHDFGSIYWPRIVFCNPTRNIVYILGGLNNKTYEVSRQCLEINLATSGSTVQEPMPVPRFAHAAVCLKEDIYVTGGISNHMMHPMRLRQVPIGSRQCFRFNFVEKRWFTDVPDLPIGKLYSTLVSIENRYLFQIGGFDDYDYEIYCLDTNALTRNDCKWTEIKLKSEIRMLKSYDYQTNSSEFNTSQNMSNNGDGETLLKQNTFLKEDSNIAKKKVKLVLPSLSLQVQEEKKEENKVEMSPIRIKAISTGSQLAKERSNDSSNSGQKLVNKKKNKDDSMLRKEKRSPSFSLGKDNDTMQQAIELAKQKFRNVIDEQGEKSKSPNVKPNFQPGLSELESLEAMLDDSKVPQVMAMPDPKLQNELRSMPKPKLPQRLGTIKELSEKSSNKSTSVKIVRPTIRVNPQTSKSQPKNSGPVVIQRTPGETKIQQVSQVSINITKSPPVIKQKSTQKSTSPIKVPQPPLEPQSNSAPVQLKVEPLVTPTLPVLKTQEPPGLSIPPKPQIAIPPKPKIAIPARPTIPTTNTSTEPKPVAAPLISVGPAQPKQASPQKSVVIPQAPQIQINVQPMSSGSVTESPLPKPVQITVSKSSPSPALQNATPLLDKKYTANSETIIEQSQNMEDDLESSAESDNPI